MILIDGHELHEEPLAFLPETRGRKQGKFLWECRDDHLEWRERVASALHPWDEVIRIADEYEMTIVYVARVVREVFPS